MPTPVLGSLIFEVIPTIQSSGSTGGDPVMVSDNNSIPAVLGGAGVPSGAPQYGTGELYVDTTNLNLYYWNGTVWQSFVAINATNAINTAITNSTTNASFFPVFVSGTSGNLPSVVDSSFTYNPSTNVLTLPGQLSIIAGTATVTPIVMTSGTLNTTAVHGAIEQNGNVLYFSPATANRALAVTPHYYRLNAAVTLANVATPQSWLGLTAGVTLQAATIYQFEGEFSFSTAGTTTSHSESLLFTLTTLTLNNIYITYERSLSAATASNTYVIANTNVATIITMASAQTAAQTDTIFRMKGTISVATGGSLRPDIQFSVAPGATAKTVNIGSYFRIWPIGVSGANIVVGTWT